jgi:hypothetical protein
MTLTVAQAVANEVQSTLLDPNARYWTTTDLCNYYNIIVTAIIGDNPKVLTKVISFVCVAGVDQICPSDATMFLRAPANTNGRTIRQVTAEALQEDDPDWYNTIPSKSILHIIPDDFDFLRFRTYPPSDGTASIQLQYAYAPDDITSLTEDFLLPESYRSEVRNGMLAMAYAKETDRQDITKVQMYFGFMKNTVADKIKTQIQLAPRQGTPQTTE